MTAYLIGYASHQAQDMDRQTMDLLATGVAETTTAPTGQDVVDALLTDITHPQYGRRNPSPPPRP
jgi:hypothetical protein